MKDRFSDVFGHDAVKDRLARLLAEGRLPNGILLVGEEGRGKRTLACAFAREILREADPIDPEGAARDAELGRHPGLVVCEPLPEERTTPVRRLRSMMGRCGLSIGRGDRRVVVLPRLHRVNTEGGNTLLKFLEEPPVGTIIVATARDPGSVLETIRSRLSVLPCAALDRDGVRSVLTIKGFNAQDAAFLAPLCDGAPGAAFRLARGNLEANLIAPLQSLLANETPASVIAEALARQAKDAGADWIEAREEIGPRAAIAAWRDLRSAQESGVDDEKASEGTLEPTRVWIRPVFEALGVVIRQCMRACVEQRSLAPPWDSVVGIATPMRSDQLPDWERRAVAVLRALENLDRNLTLPLVTESLVMAMRSR